MQFLKYKLNDKKIFLFAMLGFTHHRVIILQIELGQPTGISSHCTSQPSAVGKSAPTPAHTRNPHFHGTKLEKNRSCVESRE